jgi:hemerythrin
MPLTAWTATMSVGVEALDDDHRHLVAMLNDLYDAMREGRGAAALYGTLHGLLVYAEAHFAREERMFAATDYPGAWSHKVEHDAFVLQVRRLMQEFANGQTCLIAAETMKLLKEWLVFHIQGCDRLYTAHLNGCGIS